MSRDEIMRQWFDSLSPEEKAIARRSQRETKRHLRERQPEPVRIAYGTSTPGYYAVIEHVSHPPRKGSR